MVSESTLVFGLKLVDVLTLLGLVTGPVAAVLVSLWIERRKKIREQKSSILRIILTTRKTPADAGYNFAINLIPLEFNKSLSVMKAWREYLEIASTQYSEERKDEYNRKIEVKQSSLIFQMMRDLGYEISESDIQLEAYISKGFVDRDNLYTSALRALTELVNLIKNLGNK